MLNSNLLQEFLENGFIKIPLLEEKDIIYLRQKILTGIEPGSSGEYYIDYYTKNFDRDIFFGHPKLLNSLKILFPTPIYLPDLNIQVNRVEQSGHSKGWHFDCGAEYALKKKYLFDKNYQYLKVGIYLQDDTLEYGGGIEVQPGSHQYFYKYKNSFMRRLILGLRTLRPSIFKSKRVKITKGDAVLFDSRLMHRSSSNRTPFDLCPKDSQKIAIYWTVSGSRYLAQNYCSALIGHTISPDVSERTKAFYNSFFSKHFPEDFMQPAFSACQASKVEWYTLEKGLTDFYTRRVNDLAMSYHPS